MASKPLAGEWNERAETVLVSGSYEDVCELLEDVISLLEAGKLTLSEGLDAYELGVRLSERGEQLLTQAELRISQLDLEDDSEAERRDLLQLFDSEEGSADTPF